MDRRGLPDWAGCRARGGACRTRLELQQRSVGPSADTGCGLFDPPDSSHYGSLQACWEGRSISAGTRPRGSSARALRPLGSAAPARAAPGGGSCTCSSTPHVPAGSRPPVLDEANALFDRRADVPRRTDQGKPSPARNDAHRPHSEQEGVHADARPVPRFASRRSLTGFRKPGAAATTTGTSRCCARDATYRRAPAR